MSHACLGTLKATSFKYARFFFFTSSLDLCRITNKKRQASLFIKSCFYLTYSCSLLTIFLMAKYSYINFPIALLIWLQWISLCFIIKHSSQICEKDSHSTKQPVLDQYSTRDAVLMYSYLLSIHLSGCSYTSQIPFF